MRRPIKRKHLPQPDEVYGSLKVSKLINYVMERGKKDTARKIVYKVMEELKKDGDPVALLEEALDKASPTVEVRSRRVGGAALKGEGAAVTKRETTHRMAEANKAFAHFAW
jgi:small subunit ribosomal protein S7